MMPGPKKFLVSDGPKLRSINAIRFRDRINNRADRTTPHNCSWCGRFVGKSGYVDIVNDCFYGALEFGEALCTNCTKKIFKDITWGLGRKPENRHLEGFYICKLPFGYQAEILYWGSARAEERDSWRWRLARLDEDGCFDILHYGDGTLKECMDDCQVIWDKTVDNIFDTGEARL